MAGGQEVRYTAFLSTLRRLFQPSTPFDFERGFGMAQNEGNKPRPTIEVAPVETLKAAPPASSARPRDGVFVFVFVGADRQHLDGAPLAAFPGVQRDIARTDADDDAHAVEVHEFPEDDGHQRVEAPMPWIANNLVGGVEPARMHGELRKHNTRTEHCSPDPTLLSERTVVSALMPVSVLMAAQHNDGAAQRRRTGWMLGVQSQAGAPGFEPMGAGLEARGRTEDAAVSVIKQ
ncbi:hypothetical protein BJ138DRAFT_1115729 [Hygrophoropsis aurantiaca]|uniref:Uncharacterized protein n=1 Tax=Hygrophoropsis aurantiaca TaxID=72124 RepID=A0ACB8A4Z6_9AGAM|nr:hypothetical protein BJ138DRAFT_1115729 [Hygrophoropsis aurantiaca]